MTDYYMMTKCEGKQYAVTITKFDEFILVKSASQEGYEYDEIIFKYSGEYNENLKQNIMGFVLDNIRGELENNHIELFIDQ